MDQINPVYYVNVVYIVFISYMWRENDQNLLTYLPQNKWLYRCYFYSFENCGSDIFYELKKEIVIYMFQKLLRKSSLFCLH